MISFVWFLIILLPAIQLNLMETRLQVFYSLPMILSILVAVGSCCGLLALIWSTPSATTCTFGINCDYSSMLKDTSSWIQVPQLLRIQQMLGSYFVFPSESNGFAYTFNSQWIDHVNEVLNESVSDLFGNSHECVAPHNCISNGTRFAMTLCLVGGTILSWLFSILMLGSNKRPLPEWLKHRLSTRKERRATNRIRPRPARSATA